MFEINPFIWYDGKRQKGKNVENKNIENKNNRNVYG
jgi:hypothetical protein